ncbi:MAG: methyltransferase domain-containing protein [Ignavibacteriales bacterium]|nr:methyltransferase domain-containing protein [Ignavibacteriales bacterium]
MFQKSYLFPFLNVEENIGFGLKMQGAAPSAIQAEVKRMLNLIGLQGSRSARWVNFRAEKVSRVALARALVTNPKLLMLDEPLSSLDTSVRMNLQAAIREIQRELGITTIFVTHDLSEAMAMSDRMAILLDGEVTAYDKPDVLFHRPPCVRSAKFVGVDLFLEGESGNGWLDRRRMWAESNSTNESKVGRSVFAIRPEHIRIQKEARKNSLAGVVQSCLFRGEALELQVRLGSVTTRARLPMPAPMFAHGENVFVHLPAEHLFEVAHEAARTFACRRETFYDAFGARQDGAGYYEDVTLAELTRFAKFESGTSIAEFGCGTGRFAAEMLRVNNASYWGCDVSATMVQLSRTRLAEFGGRVTLWKSSGETKIPLQDESCDHFISNYVLDILSAREIEASVG